MNIHKEPKQCKCVCHQATFKFNEKLYCGLCGHPVSNPPQEEQPKEWMQEYDRLFNHDTKCNYSQGRKGCDCGITEIKQFIHSQINLAVQKDRANQRSEIADRLSNLEIVEGYKEKGMADGFISLADALKIVEGKE